MTTTYKIIVTLETCYRGEAKTEDGQGFFFEVAFNEIEFPEDFHFTVTTEKADLSRRYIADRCVMAVLRRAVAKKYNKPVTCKGFCVYNMPYYNLKREEINETKN